MVKLKVRMFQLPVSKLYLKNQLGGGANLVKFWPILVNFYLTSH